MDQFTNVHYNTNTTNKRVYVNRNFNRNGIDRVVTSNGNVYFNPKFSQSSNNPNVLTQQLDHSIRPRIHVNPNFIRPSVHNVSIACTSHKNTLPKAAATINYFSPTTYTQPLQTVEQVTSTQQLQSVTTYRDYITPTAVPPSRYCLVRQKEKVATITPLPIKITQTIKVNKYKSVSLTSVKKNLITDKKANAKLIKPNQIKLNPSSISKYKPKIVSKPTLNEQNTRFKYVKKSTTILNSPDMGQGKSVRRVSVTNTKSIVKINPNQTKKIFSGALKKNNVPCPLFKKYGKCLRMIRGGCDYLHDKKHVSICRKFLKGVCHNKQCLLSHDLTDKKMPTCYFYLQGNCTKEGCPYLHVKINEKAKICPDFLKGYCENGNKCVHRHVNVSFNNPSKLMNSRKSTSLTIIHKTHTGKIHNSRKFVRKEDNNKISTKTITKHQDKEAVKDKRYFKAGTNVEEQYDLIKPTRCKLGTLPSFIQL